MRLIDLRSDTVTKPSQDMREYMLNAEVGDDVFSEDPTVNRLQNKIAELLGKESALFVPSGTQANQICLNVHTQPGQEVIVDYNSHIFNYESGAAGMLSGVQLHPIIGKNGHPTAEQIIPAIRPGDDHFPQTKLICLENTHNRAGGTIFPIEEISKIHTVAKEHNIKLHLDGARLWNAAIETGKRMKEYAAYFDSVSLCFSKGLGAPVGSIVTGSKEFIKRAHYYRKAYGGGMRQVGILAAACIFAVENHFERLSEDHRNARLLAEGLVKIG
ncbi:MAG: low specificity L-threonine aldolase, partial [Calditrichia bacterium]|nr:low specificity L-threonine aldolase [Calditrichia bacterium]